MRKGYERLKNGGLSVGSLMGTNWGLLGKWVWKFMSGHEELWVRVIKSIYGPKGGLEEGESRYGSGKSTLGRGIQKVGGRVFGWISG